MLCLHRGGWSRYWIIIEHTFLMTSVCIVLLVHKLWSADSAGWTGLKWPCIAWLAQRRAYNNVTSLLWCLHVLYCTLASSEFLAAFKKSGIQTHTHTNQLPHAFDALHKILLFQIPNWLLFTLLDDFSWVFIFSRSLYRPISCSTSCSSLLALICSLCG